MVNASTTVTAPATGDRRVRNQPHYMQLAGTNIEDYDRAMRSSVAAARRTAVAAHTVEAEVTP